MFQYIYYTICIKYLTGFVQGKLACQQLQALGMPVAGYNVPNAAENLFGRGTGDWYQKILLCQVAQYCEECFFLCSFHHLRGSSHSLH